MTGQQGARPIGRRVVENCKQVASNDSRLDVLGSRIEPICQELPAGLMDWKTPVLPCPLTELMCLKVHVRIGVVYLGPQVGADLPVPV